MWQRALSMKYNAKMREWNWKLESAFGPIDASLLRSDTVWSYTYLLFILSLLFTFVHALWRENKTEQTNLIVKFYVRAQCHCDASFITESASTMTAIIFMNIRFHSHCNRCMNVRIGDAQSANNNKNIEHQHKYVHSVLRHGNSL